MFKKLLLLISISLFSISSFSYSQLNFGIGVVDEDSDYVRGTASDIFISYSGYTDSNVLYEVGYNYYSTDYYELGSVYDLDAGILKGKVGYGFGDLEEGSFFLNGIYINRSLEVDGVNANDQIDRSGFGVEVGYMRMGEDSTNFEIYVELDLDDCEYNCETLWGGADFPIGSSNWNFGFKAGISGDLTWFSIGPSIKF